MNLGTAIRKTREAKGLSQKEVALASKIDNSNYSKIESGKTDPSFSSIVKIAKALGVELADLFRADELFKEVNSKDKTLMEKIAIINTLAKDEQQAIFKVIDLAASNKRLKDNLTQLIAE
jgi:transcriptional regulator with XRE-family HTH domain